MRLEVIMSKGLNITYRTRFVASCERCEHGCGKLSCLSFGLRFEVGDNCEADDQALAKPFQLCEPINLGLQLGFNRHVYEGRLSHARIL